MAEPEQLVVEAQRQAEAATTLEELSAVRTAVSGKRAPLVADRKELGALDPDARREAGQALNAAKAPIDEILSSCEAELAAAARAEKLAVERLDLTEVTDQLANGHLHVITQTWQELEDMFVGMGYRVAEARRSRASGTTNCLYPDDSDREAP